MGKDKGIAEATDALQEAKRNHVQADEDHMAALNKQVDYGSFSFQSLSECNKEKSVCWNDAMMTIYQKAAAEVEQTKQAKEEAERKVEEAEKALEDAKNAAEESADPATQQVMVEVKRTEMVATNADDHLKQTMQEAKLQEAIDCECKAKAEYEKEWEIASKGPQVQSQEIAYARAKRMLCVVDGTPEQDCNVDDVPKVQKATFPEDVQAAVCTKNGNDGKKYETTLFTQSATEVDPIALRELDGWD